MKRTRPARIHFFILQSDGSEGVDGICKNAFSQNYGSRSHGKMIRNSLGLRVTDTTANEIVIRGFKEEVIRWFKGCYQEARTF